MSWMGGHFILFGVGGGCVRVESAERVYAMYRPGWSQPVLSRVRRVARIYK